MINWILLTYGFYLVFSVVLTVWVGRVLYQKGQVFVNRALQDFQRSQSVNRFLLAGYYIVNSAYVLLVLKDETEVENGTDMIELLSQKLGLIVVVLALMHFVNMGTLFFFKNYWQRNPLPKNT